jgi:hypothetical protein
LESEGKAQRVEDTAMHVVVQVGPSIASCMGVRRGEHLIRRSEVSQFIWNYDPDRLSILCNAGSISKPFSVTVDVQAPHRHGNAEILVSARKAVPGWKIQLSDSQFAPRSTVPIQSGMTSLGHIEPARYMLNLQIRGERITLFGLSVHQITIPDGIEAGLKYVRDGKFRHAGVVFRQSLSLFPGFPEIHDLICLSASLYAAEIAARVTQGQHIDVVRDTPDPDAVGAEFLAQAAARVGAANLAHVLTTIQSAFGSMHVSDATLPPLPWQTREALDRLTDSIYEKLSRQLANSMTEIGELRKEVTNIANTLVPKFESLISARMGDRCWVWLGKDIQARLVEGESQYKSLAFRTVDLEPNFFLALFSLCSGLELLLNTHLAEICRTIRRVSKLDEVTLYLRSNPNIDISAISDGHLTLGMLPRLLLASRKLLVHFRQLFSNEDAIVISGINNPHLINPIAWLASQLRNPVSHSKPVPWMDMLIARKLLFGIDEYGIPEGRAASSMKHMEAGSRRRQESWQEYPGILYLLWMAFEDRQMIK